MIHRFQSEGLALQSIGIVIVITMALLPSLAMGQTVPFAPQQMITGAGDGPRTIVPADIDGDGDLDAVCCSEYDDEVFWLENVNGVASFGSPQMISTVPDAPHSVAAADLDGDGDIDLLTASSNDSRIAWFENTDGAGTFGAINTISTLAAGAVVVHAADLDGDGDPDALSASLQNDRIAWNENRLNEVSADFGTQQIITNIGDGGRWVSTADLDADGDLDVLATFHYDDRVVWCENTDGAGTFGPAQPLSTPDPDSIPDNGNEGELDGPVGIGAADLDGDGDLDIFTATSHTNSVAWFENRLDEVTADIGTPEVITTAADGGYSVAAVDLDGDGDLDLVSSSYQDDKIAWYENDGSGVFGSQQVIAAVGDGAVMAAPADVDGDGDEDILAASLFDDEVFWHENLSTGHGAPLVDSGQELGSDASFDVELGDLDGDGDLDAFVANYTAPGVPNAVWINAGAGTFTDSGQSLGNSDSRGLALGDLDGDGDLDAFVDNWNQANRVWINQGGAQAGTEGQFADSGQAMGSSASRDVGLGDLDGDGDLDAFVVNFNQANRVWINQGGAQAGTEGQFLDSGQSLGSSASTDVGLGDLDGDGDLDAFVSNYSLQPNRVWVNQGGAQAGTEGQFLNSGQSLGSWGSLGVALGDVDSDGDLDAYVGNHSSPNRLWLNDGSGTFVDSGLALGNATTLSVALADLDLDGDLDAFDANALSPSMVWLNSGSGGFTDSGLRLDPGSTVYSYGVDVGDLDGDGDTDAFVANSLAAGAEPNRVYLNEMIHRSAAFGDQQVISTANSGARWIDAVDLDGDGDLDALVGSINDDEVAWYENTDGAGNFGPQQIITNLADEAYSLDAADFDGDGDPDVVSASRLDDKIAWYGNTDGAGTFGPQQVISTAADGAYSVFAADLDGDGDMDILLCSLYDDTVAWHENTDGAGTFSAEQPINTPDPDGIPGNGNEGDADLPVMVCAADLDADGDLDVLSASYNDDKIAWYENTDGAGSFGPQRVISTAADGARGVFAADLDGDGDLDVLSASDTDDKAAWYENTDGSGTFGSQQVISTEGDASYAIFAEDIDGDGDLDVLVASVTDDEVSLYLNTGGGTFGPQQVISTAGDGVNSVLAADIDSDGDPDVLAASTTDSELAWYENRGGQFALTTTAQAPFSLGNGVTSPVMAIVPQHLGWPYDTDIELASIDLLLEESDGDPLTSGEANALIESLQLWIDDGTDNPDYFREVDRLTTLLLDGEGRLTMTLASGEPDLRFIHGSPAVLHLLVETTADAIAQSPDQFQITHVTETSSVAEDAAHHIPLTMAYAEDTPSGVVEVGVPEINVTVSSLAIGNQDVDDGAATGGVAVESLGSASLHFVTGTEITGTDAAQFAIDPTTITAMSAGSSREVVIEFDPEILGDHGATLTLVTDDPDEPTVSVTLSGVGIQKTTDLAEMLVGTQATPPMNQCDINEDGALDAADLVNNVNTVDNP
ncbi:VCBS repeat-containing protein [Candidatus Sumerlaeota bacterium]|nr:VCBS repeat-containing protein [Candidatus Sumerlaeota bacterium]